jgi:hypothetical protein
MKNLERTKYGKTSSSGLKETVQEMRITNLLLGELPAPVAVRSAARSLIALMLRSWVWIPPKSWCSSSSFCVMLSSVGRGLFDELIARPTESQQVSKLINKRPVCVAAKVLKRTVDPQMNVGWLIGHHLLSRNFGPYTCFDQRHQVGDLFEITLQKLYFENKLTEMEALNFLFQNNTK